MISQNNRKLRSYLPRHDRLLESAYVPVGQVVIQLPLYRHVGEEQERQVVAVLEEHV